jgi:hypothetical protein
MLWQWKFRNAVAANSGVAIVTKANPRERFVAASSISLTSVTAPVCENKSRKSCSLTLGERLPM